MLDQDLRLRFNSICQGGEAIDVSSNLGEVCMFDAVNLSHNDSWFKNLKVHTRKVKGLEVWFNLAPNRKT